MTEGTFEGGFSETSEAPTLRLGLRVAAMLNERANNDTRCLGAIIVPSQAAVLGMGFDALILAFVVVVIGGLGSLQGALVGALIVSFVRTAGIQFFSEVELAVLYLIAAVVLLVKPTGLFGDA
jgi:hypothetical protein